MIDHFAPQHTHPLTYAQIDFIRKVRAILDLARLDLEVMGWPPVPTRGYDHEDTIAALVYLTPPPVTAATWEMVDREARETETV
jgi:hypothetical protein